MILKVQDWYGIHTGFILNLNVGYTALVGPNGAGKTTLLHQIREFAQQENALIFSYSNLCDGGSFAENAYGFKGDFESLATVKTSSEGEAIAINFSQVITKIGAMVGEARKTHQPLFILLDALDSGASIDRIRELRSLFKLIEEDTANMPVYLVVAGNSFEMAKNADCVDVRTGRHLRFSNYEQYAKFICDFEKTHPTVQKESGLKRKRMGSVRG